MPEHLVARRTCLIHVRFPGWSARAAGGGCLGALRLDAAEFCLHQ